VEQYLDSVLCVRKVIEGPRWQEEPRESLTQRTRAGWKARKREWRRSRILAPFAVAYVVVVEEEGPNLATQSPVVWWLTH